MGTTSGSPGQSCFKKYTALTEPFFQVVLELRTNLKYIVSWEETSQIPLFRQASCNLVFSSCQAVTSSCSRFCEGLGQSFGPSRSRTSYRSTVHPCVSFWKIDPFLLEQYFSFIFPIVVQRVLGGVVVPVCLMTTNLTGMRDAYNVDRCTSRWHAERMNMSSQFGVLDANASLTIDVLRGGEHIATTPAPKKKSSPFYFSKRVSS